MKLACVPYDDPTNAYIFRMKQILGKFGDVVEVNFGFVFILKCLFGGVKRYDALIINWEENRILNRSGYFSVLRAIRLFMKLIFYKIVSKKIVFVRHNNYPHATAYSQRNFVKKWIDIYENCFDASITHSKIDERKNRKYCPHPLYKIDQSFQNDKSDEEKYFLVFGRILPYKNIDKLIDNFPLNKSLVVMGPIGNSDYFNLLKSKQRNGLELRPGYVPDEIASEVVSKSTAIVIAHAEENVVVSGTFFYAISHGVPIIAVETPFMKWANERYGDKVVKLIKSIDEISAAIEDYKKSSFPNDLKFRLIQDFGDDAIFVGLKEILN